MKFVLPAIVSSILTVGCGQDPEPVATPPREAPKVKLGGFIRNEIEYTALGPLTGYYEPGEGEARAIMSFKADVFERSMKRLEDLAEQTEQNGSGGNSRVYKLSLGSEQQRREVSNVMSLVREADTSFSLESSTLFFFAWGSDNRGAILMDRVSLQGAFFEEWF